MTPRGSRWTAPRGQFDLLVSVEAPMTRVSGKGGFGAVASKLKEFLARAPDEDVCKECEVVRVQLLRVHDTQSPENPHLFVSKERGMDRLCLICGLGRTDWVHGSDESEPTLELLRFIDHNVNWICTKMGRKVTVPLAGYDHTRSFEENARRPKSARGWLSRFSDFQLRGPLQVVVLVFGGFFCWACLWWLLHAFGLTVNCT